MLLDVDSIKKTLSTKNGQNFFERVWRTPPAVYEARLKAIGFERLGRVLDAGSGFGQWSVSLASLNTSVLGIDPNDERIAASRLIANSLELKNLNFLVGAIESLPFGRDSFDAIFCYSVLYLTDYRQTLQRLYETLKPGGLFYFTTNGIGWYVYNLIEGHNDADDFSSRQMAIDAFQNSLGYYSGGEHIKGKSIIMPQELVLKDLRSLGFEIVAAGPDASIGREKFDIQSFYEEKKYGLESVYEVLCRK